MNKNYQLEELLGEIMLELYDIEARLAGSYDQELIVLQMRYEKEYAKKVLSRCDQQGYFEALPQDKSNFVNSITGGKQFIEAYGDKEGYGLVNSLRFIGDLKHKQGPLYRPNIIIFKLSFEEYKNLNRPEKLLLTTKITPPQKND